MVNHVRTLLLNENASSVNDVGGCFPVDRSFSKLNLVGDLAFLHSQMFLGDTGIEQKIRVVNSVFSFVNRVDLRVFFDMLDTRNTEYTRADVEVPRSVFTTSFAFRTAFKQTGILDLDNAISKLKSIYTGKTDGALGVAAAVVAFVFQLEAVRRKNGV